jgi:hypothetical protein
MTVAKVHVIGEVYLCSLISLISAQKACEDAGIQLQVDFHEDSVPGFAELCAESHRQGHAFMTIAPGSVGFSEKEDMLQAYVADEPLCREVPISLDPNREPMTESSPSFFTLDAATIASVSQDPSSQREVAESIPRLGERLKGVVEYTFQGSVGRRNFLKLR